MRASADRSEAESTQRASAGVVARKAGAGADARPESGGSANGVAQLAALANRGAQAKATAGYQRLLNGNEPNRTGLPDALKAGVERLSGVSLDGVRVHYNSDKPAQLQAHAYTQGAEIHVGPGQERHLPHEAWHAAQQAEGRVQATAQLKGVGINDDAGLEAEADVMGAAAHARASRSVAWRTRDGLQRKAQTGNGGVIQCNDEDYKKLLQGPDISDEDDERLDPTYVDSGGETDLGETDLMDEGKELEHEMNERGHNLDMSNLNITSFAHNIEKSSDKESKKTGKIALHEKGPSLVEQNNTINPTLGHYEEVSVQDKFLEFIAKQNKENEEKLRERKDDTKDESLTLSFQEHRPGVKYKSKTYKEDQPIHFDPGVIHKEPKIFLSEKDTQWKLTPYDGKVVLFGKEGEESLGKKITPSKKASNKKKYRSKMARPFGVVEFEIPTGGTSGEEKIENPGYERYYFRPPEKSLGNEERQKEYKEGHSNLKHRKISYEKLKLILVHTSPTIPTITKQLKELTSLREHLEENGDRVIEQGDYYAQKRAKTLFKKYQKGEYGIPAIPELNTNFTSKGEGGIADMGALTKDKFEDVKVLALPPPSEKRKSLEDYVNPEEKISQEELETWMNIKVDHTPTLISARLKKRKRKGESNGEKEKKKIKE